MEENISHVIEMTFCVFLFVFALSAAMMRYNSMNATAENLISINVINRRGTAVDAQLAASEIKRKADYAEIALAVLNLDNNINLTGNDKYSVRVEKLGNKTCTCTYEEEDDGYGTIIGKIVLEFDSGAQLEYYTGDLAGITTRNSTADFLNDAVSFFAGATGDTKYNVSYTENSIVYKEVL